MSDFAEQIRPELPRPTCRVRLICGPPAAGKTSYVKKHAAPGDIIIDLDLIAREYGYGYDRPSWVIGDMLDDRNARLARLAQEPPQRVAWVVLTAPSQSLRQWWRQALNVQRDDLVLLVPPWKELHRRIMADPARREVRQRHLQLVAKWFRLERNNDPGVIKQDIGEDGHPTDPLHPWNRTRACTA